MLSLDFKSRCVCCGLISKSPSSWGYFLTFSYHSMRKLSLAKWHISSQEIAKTVKSNSLYFSNISSCIKNEHSKVTDDFIGFITPMILPQIRLLGHQFQFYICDSGLENVFLFCVTGSQRSHVVYSSQRASILVSGHNSNGDAVNYDLSQSIHLFTNILYVGSPIGPRV